MKKKNIKTVHSNKAFTLVELAIVIVIIGLLVGGVLQGAELIAASKRQAVMKWYTQMEAAYHTFRGKYNCIPGDCVKAQSFWGASTTSNGDGNGKIEVSSSSVTEYVYAIEHLSLANLFKGSYLYTNNNPTGGFRPCLNTPCPGGERAGFQIFYNGSDAQQGWAKAYNKRSGNAVYYAGDNIGSNVMVGGVYTPEEAFIFDTKFDDGKPDGGKIFGGGGHRNSTFQTGCVGNSWGSTATQQAYQVQNKEPTCVLLYYVD